jgi:hypothetical protein
VSLTPDVLRKTKWSISQLMVRLGSKPHAGYVS